MALLVCLGFALLWFFLTFTSGFACSGEGGSPYAARDSTVGRLCEVTPVRVLWGLGVLLAPVVVLAGAIVGVQRRSGRVLAVSAAVGLGAFLLVCLPYLVLPDRCSSEQEASGADCDHY